ncbi:unnamed protein product [Penicillium salamii]|uniref:Uncharacterized protein n=1 Tax=Penicillium salamii TaxID=1612424 RepID=A0A9W4J3Q9_9EURO|nr:unnamed protein product [Penicillium salamii]
MLLFFPFQLPETFLRRKTSLGLFQNYNRTRKRKYPYRGEKGGPPVRVLNFYEGLRGVYFEAEVFADIIKAEYCLREIVQRRLPIGTINNEYYSLRQSSTWYLRQELVNDCAKRGGCCSRNCECCQTRHERAVRNKGLGHCTPSCGCCTSERGFEYSAEEIQSFVDGLKAQLYNDNPAYTVHMAEAFFLLPPADTERKEPMDRGFF